MNIAVVFAGGVGTRMGADVPKQFLELNGKPVLAHTLGLFQDHPLVDEIVLAKPLTLAECGASAQDSIYSGLKAAAAKYPADTVVLLHDGVRPYVLPDVITANIEAVERFGNAVTYTPCYETIVISKDGETISSMPYRKESYTAQAPQSFRLGEILAAHEKIRARPEGYTDMVDQATICWTLGIPIHLVPGNRGNVKITTPEDIISLDALLKAREAKGATA